MPTGVQLPPAGVRAQRGEHESPFGSSLEAPSRSIMPTSAPKVSRLHYFEPQGSCFRSSFCLQQLRTGSYF